MLSALTNITTLHNKTQMVTMFWLIKSMQVMARMETKEISINLSKSDETSDPLTNILFYFFIRLFFQEIFLPLLDSGL